MTPILFETFNVSAIYVAIQAVLSLCGSLHRDETCLLPTETAVPLATSAVPVATTTLAAPAMHAAPVLPVSYAATAPIVEYVSPAPAGSYVAPALVVDTTRQLQWCLLLHQRLSSIRRASSSGVFCCTSACRRYDAPAPVVSCVAPAPVWRLRHWRHPQCTPHMDPLSSTSLQYYLICRDSSRSVHRARSSRVRGTSACGGVHRARSSRVRGTSAFGGVHRARSSCARGTSAFGGVHRARSSRERGTSVSRPLQPCTRRKRLWWSTLRPALAVYAAQAPHCASTGILLEAFKKVPPCTWRSRPYCLYMVRESVQQSVRVLTRSL